MVVIRRLETTILFRGTQWRAHRLHTSAYYRDAAVEYGREDVVVGVQQPYLGENRIRRERGWVGVSEFGLGQ